MKVNVVQIGNSKGIRIPKAILEQCNIIDEVDLEVADGKIVLEPSQHKPRIGWNQKFAEMAANADDHLLMDDLLDSTFEEWEW
ncbi:MAG TPA: AbrB/MazE/SpoVT family DNA-binding domain-containing protein [Spirochaetia bacterium]|nr:AbrB/MazE/SpoVT family DNA-binding domain-containing protein [Spirochaetia bacterium]